MQRSGMVTFSHPRAVTAALKASQSGQILELPDEDKGHEQIATGLKGAASSDISVQMSRSPLFWRNWPLYARIHHSRMSFS